MNFDEIFSIDHYHLFGTIILLVVFITPCVCTMCTAEAGAVLGIFFGSIGNLVISIILVLRYSRSLEVLDDHEDKLDTYPGLNRCVDKYTQVNIDQVKDSIGDYRDTILQTATFNYVFLGFLVAPYCVFILIHFVYGMGLLLGCCFECCRDSTNRWMERRQ